MFGIRKGLNIKARMFKKARHNTNTKEGCKIKIWHPPQSEKYEHD